jgi:hypothetical protein
MKNNNKKEHERFNLKIIKSNLLRIQSIRFYTESTPITRKTQFYLLNTLIRGVRIGGSVLWLFFKINFC